MTNFVNILNKCKVLWRYEQITGYTINSDSFSLFSYFSNALECCKCERRDFTE